MGNTATKERSASPHGSRNRGESSSMSGRHQYDSRSRSRRDLGEATLFGLAGSSREHRERDREAERAAREARRQERERERQREKERSLREESVDGGFLVTHGVYTGPEDFKDKIVRQLIIERRLAPFFKGLRDHEDNWTDAQLYAAVKELPIPGPDAEPPKEEVPKLSEKSLSTDLLTVPLAPRSRSHSYTSDGSGPSSTCGNILGGRTRSKTLSISSPRNPTLPNTAGPQEINIPSRFVEGRPIEAVLYQNASECPICFLYYPPYINKTRCCDQEICSECFVQIKRADPHVPDSHDSNPNQEPSNSIADRLVSEPATCPFCKQPEFGVTYAPPPFRRGLVYASTVPDPASTTTLPTSDLSTPSGASPSSRTSPPLSPSGRRRFILPPTSPEVVTTDQIRPDWAQKLASARAHAARRAAAATALHTAAFLMSNPAPGSSSGGGGSSSGSYSRRLMRRARENSGNSGRTADESPSPNHSGSRTPQEGTARGPSLLALGMGSGRERERHSPDVSIEQNLINMGFISRRETSRERQHAHDVSGGNRERTHGRHRIADLEEMMLMEAIRLSLVEEEERKKREEEKKAKEAKEQQYKSSPLPGLTPAISSSSSSSTPHPPPPSAALTAESSSLSSPPEGKGKSPERPQPPPPVTLNSSPTSSSASSENTADEHRDIDANEPMWNFQSLAAMITNREGSVERDVNGGTEGVEVEVGKQGVQVSETETVEECKGKGKERDVEAGAA
ncbi:hypothetical protein EX30DRAFT_370932 [Ascodesmis nigricans]|uniref:Protein sip5 n=1 Tax=Ascodesmis nigricans TaxID=341454 RepID=A0A4S2N063_9PEZI|nr:hypothetical protein EX30DRAFT_370932 [Ascodesmis nigricans]